MESASLEAFKKHADMALNLVGMVVTDWWLDLVISMVISTLHNDFVIL